ncbi:hypothetical protein Hdeb2414_s0007g00254401 [Helianthus debilis subsp. tardiflorus]
MNLDNCNLYSSDLTFYTKLLYNSISYIGLVIWLLLMLQSHALFSRTSGDSLLCTLHFFFLYIKHLVQSLYFDHI